MSLKQWKELVSGLKKFMERDLILKITYADDLPKILKMIIELVEV